MRVENRHTHELDVPAGNVINLFTHEVVVLGRKECIYNEAKDMMR